MSKHFKAYTDGSCLGDGSGGWGVVIVEDNKVRSLLNNSELILQTTNNREEIKAVYEGIKRLYEISNEEDTLEIITDSAYVCNMCTDWIYKWHDAGWRKYDGGEVKNLDLVSSLYSDYLYNNKIFSKKQIVTFTHVKGHNGDLWNELADGLATRNSKKIVNQLIKAYGEDYKTALSRDLII